MVDTVAKSIQAKMDEYDKMATDVLQNGSVEDIRFVISNNDRLNNHTLSQFFNTTKAASNRHVLEAHGVFLGVLNGKKVKIVYIMSFVAGAAFFMGTVAQLTPEGFFKNYNKVVGVVGLKGVDLTAGPNRLAEMAKSVEQGARGTEMFNGGVGQWHASAKSTAEAEHAHIKGRKQELEEQSQSTKHKDGEKARMVQEQGQEEHGAKSAMWR